jgi:hypothetical protein
MEKADELKTNVAPMDEIQVEMDVFGKPPVLKSENLDDYWKLARSLRWVIKPKTFVERIWLRDVTDLTWEVFRLRRIKIEIIESGRSRATPSLCHLTIDVDAFRKASAGKTQKKAAKFIKELSTTFVEENDGLITAEGFASRLSTLDGIERMLTSAEHRRNVVYREIEFHRELAAMRARKISDDFIARSDNIQLLPSSNESVRENGGTASEKDV